MNDIWYKTNSIFEAILLTLESFYALDCEYPAKAKHLWEFIQISGFDIRPPNQRFALKVIALVKEVDKILKNREQNTA